MRNRRAKRSKKSECDGREDSIEITVPPMGVAVFSCTAQKAPVKEKAKTPGKPSAKAEPVKNTKAAKAEKKAEEPKKAAEKKGRGKKA